MKKVIANLGIQLDQRIHQQIERLVLEYRRRAASETCATLRPPLETHLKQYRDAVLWPELFAKDAQHRAAKYAPIQQLTI